MNEAYQEEPEDQINEKFYRFVEPETGRRYRLGDLTNPNKNRPNLTYEFLGVERVWRWTKDRMQKAYDQGLIVQSKPGTVPSVKRYLDEQSGSLVDDIPLCRCATTLEAAQKLNRKWVGIDIAIHAIKRVAKVRLEDRLKMAEGTDFVIEGVPHSLEGAQDLWTRDKYHFQKWAVEQVDGFVTSKRTADGGIDGRIYFSMPNETVLQSMVLEVKGGKNVTIADLRALHSVLEREEALMAGLIIMHPLGAQKMRNFQKLMAEAGDLDVMGRLYSRVQLITVPEILDGKRFDTFGAVGRGDPQKVLGLQEQA